MANAFLKPTKIVSTGLGLLEREIVLGGLVYRDAAIDHQGAANDVVSVRFPAYVEATERTLRAGTPVTFAEDLTETKVDVTLSKDIMVPKAITDEQLTLDITDFGEQVLNPIVSATARGVEKVIADTMIAATYQTTISWNESSPRVSVISARRALHDANVPQSGRALVLGSGLEASLLADDLFIRADASGATSALREAQLGRILGFDVYTSNLIPPYAAYAFHKSAYVLASRAPVAPQGAVWSASAAHAGFAMRVLRDYDAAYLRDRIITNSYVGCAPVTDEGTINGFGKFTPAAGQGAKFVRAVKLGSNTSS